MGRCRVYAEARAASCLNDHVPSSTRSCYTIQSSEKLHKESRMKQLNNHLPKKNSVLKKTTSPGGYCIIRRDRDQCQGLEQRCTTIQSASRCPENYRVSTE
eukprot:16448510-Heterocapsa_arctica.AAC.1